jgi:hypothetical protein
MLRIIFLELKAPRGKQTKQQKEFQAMVEAIGAEYNIVRSVEDLQRVME